jgi:hypothetical protein
VKKPPNLVFQNTKVAHVDTKEARLVFWNEELVAVVSKLGPLHGRLESHWFIECAFGLPTKGADTFSSLETLTAYLSGLCAHD